MTAAPTYAAHRPIVMSDSGLVVAGHHLAAEAGAEIMRAGGNAMDGAVAAAACLAVVLPHMNGLGGDAIALWSDSDGKVTAINGSGAVPSEVSSASLRKAGLTEFPRRGPLTVTVPGAVAAWGEALDRFGTRSLSEVLAPAIRVALKGVPIDATFAAYLNGPDYAEHSAEFPKLTEIFGPAGGRSIGERIKQPAVATTLGALGQHGWRAFYQGALSARWLTEARGQGVRITQQDLEEHRTTFEDALSIDWQGRRVHVAPPNSQGLALLIMIGLIAAQPFPPPSDGSDPIIDPVPYLARKMAAFRVRDRYCADPRRVRLPPDLLSPKALKALDLGSASTISMAGAGDTSTLVVMDKDGNAVSWVQSLFEAFGSGIVCKEHGLVLHCRALLERLDDDPVRSLQGGMRPFHTLCPAMVTGPEGPELTLATPGDHGQPQLLYQVLRRHFEQGLDIQSTVEWPRIRHNEGTEILLEERSPRSWDAALAAGGWTVRRVENFSRVMGSVTAVRRMPDGLLMGGADARRSSYAVGV